MSCSLLGVLHGRYAHTEDQESHYALQYYLESE